MRDYSENGESPVSDESNQGYTVEDAVQEALDDWVADESLPAYRKGDYVAVNEEMLVENIAFMIAVAMREAVE